MFVKSLLHIHWWKYDIQPNLHQWLDRKLTTWREWVLLSYDRGQPALLENMVPGFGSSKIFQQYCYSLYQLSPSLVSHSPLSQERTELVLILPWFLVPWPYLAISSKVWPGDWIPSYVEPVTVRPLSSNSQGPTRIKPLLFFFLLSISNTKSYLYSFLIQQGLMYSGREWRFSNHRKVCLSFPTKKGSAAVKIQNSN